MATKSRLLVLDDARETLITYRIILELAGYDVETASSGRAGLALLQSKRFDLVLSDLRMPHGSGLEVLAETHENGPHVPIVIITAFGTPAVRAASTLLGAVDFVDKLPDDDELIDVVQRNLREFRPQLSKTAPIGHAARRWVSIVMSLANSSTDLPTLSEWGHEIAVAPTTIKAWCNLAGVHAGDSLDFARALRLVQQHCGEVCRWHQVLDIVSASALERFLGRTGLPEHAPLPNLETFLENQRLISDPDLLNAVRLFRG